MVSVTVIPVPGPGADDGGEVDRIAQSPPSP